MSLSSFLSVGLFVPLLFEFIDERLAHMQQHEQRRWRHAVGLMLFNELHILPGFNLIYKFPSNYMIREIN